MKIANLKKRVGSHPGSFMYYFHLEKLQLPWVSGDRKTKLKSVSLLPWQQKPGKTRVIPWFKPGKNQGILVREPDLPGLNPMCKKSG